MADITSLSDEELLGMRSQPGGDISSLSDEELLSMRGGTNQSKFLSDAPIEGASGKSPLGLIDRMKLSFADDAGREQYLRDRFSIVERLENGKFAVGDNPNEVNPIDPEGVFNDVMGDLADVVSEIPVIAGQVMGATAGLTGGLLTGGTGSVPAAIALGGAGAAGGETIRQLIGKGLGVNQKTALGQATDVAISGAFGATGEALIPASKFAGRGLKSGLSKQIAKMAMKTAKVKGIPVEETLTAKATAKVFNTLSNVPEESTLTAFKHGIEETLGNPRNLDKNYVVPLARRLQDTLRVAKSTKGKAVGDATDKLLSKSAQKLDITDTYSQLRNDLIDLDIIDDLTGKINPNVFGGDAKKVTLARKALSAAQGADKTLKNFPRLDKVEMPLKKVIKFRQQLGDTIDSNMSPGIKRALTRFVSGGDEIAGQPAVKGIRTLTNELAEKTGNKGYIKANREFHELMDMFDELNFTKKSDLVSLERFIKGQERLPVVRSQALKSLDDSLPQGQKFLKDIEMWNAAQDFTHAKPDLLRFGFVTALLASTFGSENLFDKPIPKLAGGLLIGTPAGQRILLRGAAKTGKFGKNIGKAVPRTAAGAEKIKQRELINALISTAGRQQFQR